MLVKRKHYRPIPVGATIVERRGQKLAQWTNPRGRAFTVPVNDRGDRIVIESRQWYVRFRMPDGGWKEWKAYNDKTASGVLEAQILRKLERGEVGLTDPMDDYARMPVSEHLDAFEQHLVAKNNSPDHIERTVARVRLVLDGIGAKTIAGITPGKVEAELARLRKDEGLSISSSNHYFRAMRSFSLWLVDDRRVAANPIAGLRALQLNDKDKIRRRRNLTDAEMMALLDAARKSEVVFADISGADRSMLYTVAASTGLRASELASLTPESFRLKDDPPTVHCHGGYTKNGQEAVLPLRRELATEIAEWLKPKAAKTPLWPGNWAAFSSAKMIRTDLDAARQAWLDEAKEPKERERREKSSQLLYTDSAGRVADFHALRHTFISNLARAGVHPKNAQALARHSTITLTMDHYTHTILGDLAADVAKLPPLGQTKPPQTQAAALRDTGTDGRTAADDGNHARKRRTNWRSNSVHDGQDAGSSDMPWQNGRAGSAQSQTAKTRGKSRDLAASGTSCRSQSRQDAIGPCAPGNKIVSVFRRFRKVRSGFHNSSQARRLSFVRSAYLRRSIACHLAQERQVRHPARHFAGAFRHRRSPRLGGQQLQRQGPPFRRDRPAQAGGPTAPRGTPHQGCSPCQD